jgi:hypothetical protein
LKFLFVNNVACLVGGTAQCTLSMVKSFPDCEHHILALAGEFSAEDKQLFGSNCTLVTGPRVARYLSENHFDVICYQNSRIDDIPHQPPQGTLCVYIAHSPAAPVRLVPERVQKFCVVSEFLKQKLKCDWPVIHQPVQKPTPYASVGTDWCRHQRKSGKLVIGKLCTPNNQKWKLADFIESLLAIDSDNRYQKAFHFVGAPQIAIDAITSHVESPMHFSPPSPHARGYLCEWDVLLTATSIEETFGRTVREAQRAGCVPVVSRIGGFVEQITDGTTGMLCEDTRHFVTSCDHVRLWRDKFRSDCMYAGDRDGSLATFRTNFLNLLTA